MRKKDSYVCVVERFNGPAGDTRLKLVHAAQTGKVVRLLLRLAQWAQLARRPAEIPSSDTVFTVDVEKRALAAMLQPWRRRGRSYGAGTAVQLVFAGIEEPPDRLGPGFSL